MFVIKLTWKSQQIKAIYKITRKKPEAQQKPECRALELKFQRGKNCSQT